MIKRLLVGIAGGSLLATVAAIGSASVAQAECMDWKEDGLPQDYCYISRSEAHVWATFHNKTDREVRITSIGGLNRKNWQEFEVRPGTSQWLVGNASSGVDIVATVEWCPTKTYTANCDGKLSAQLKWKNPSIGWPWMSVDNNEHGFKSMERYTFEKAFGPAGAKGVAKFKTVRLTDMSSGTKRFEVDFTFASR